MTTTREMTRDTTRAPRMKTGLLTARLPSCAAAAEAVSESDTAEVWWG
jgi:hypothetical protein